MSYAIITDITIKKDGVYLRSKMNNDSEPLRNSRVSFLSDAYKEQGQRGLDVAMLELVTTGDGMLNGDHSSIMRYREVLGLPKSRELLDNCQETITELYSHLTKEDRLSLRGDNPTPAGQACWEQSEKLRAETYGKLADKIARRDKRRETEVER
jgi:hypothetical protein